MVDPKVIIRMGSHAEKDYIEKTARYLDGIIVGANLFEATPGATSTLLGKKLNKPYYIDPMTYVYGRNLKYIKSPQGKTRELDFKRSYKRLSEKLSLPFISALRKDSMVTPKDFEGDFNIEECCKAVMEYQLNRIKENFDEDPEYKEYAADIIGPASIYAPYFYIEPNNHDAWMDLVLLLAKVSTDLKYDVPVHAIICTDESMLDNNNFLVKLKREILKTGVEGVWFWFSDFDELTIGVEKLKAFRSLVEDLSKEIKVYNLHGGYFSLSLCKYGLTGVSHGVGYGEKKSVVPVIGAATPTVRYHLPDFHKRLGVPAIQRCFDSLKIKTPVDFHEKICGCVVCKGVVSKNLSEFSLFGDMAYSTPMSKREAQTPAAAKRCRFHFLMNRIQERNEMKEKKVEEILAEINAVEDIWSEQVSVKGDMTHLVRWREALA